MRKIAAHYWLRPDASVGRFPIVTFDDRGRIIEIRERDYFKEEPSLELVNGFLVPGFVDICNVDTLSLNNSLIKKILSTYLINGVKLLGVSQSQFGMINECSPKQLNIVSTYMNGDRDYNTFSKIKAANDAIEALRCFTSENAQLLNVQETFGSLEVGKSPGLLSIQGMDYTNFQLSDKSKLKIVL
ncbi:hypothetical protein [Labilibacter marinus]|uniref:hypothetical protein n=1 Tax=Labilibacter marinus TaxID=1477105 RepID=UPI00094F57BC|nr:hypothetical protein [Labilibacter marinus]